MGTEQLEREFPGCVVPAELDKGWWKESRGVETVEEVRASTEAPAVARHIPYSFPPAQNLTPYPNVALTSRPNHVRPNDVHRRRRGLPAW